MINIEIEKLKEMAHDDLVQLKEEIEILQKNITECEKIIDNMQTDEDIEKFRDFDIESGLNIIDLFW